MVSWLKTFFLEINTIFCTFCVVTDIVCCCVPPNSASFFKVCRRLKKVAAHWFRQMFLPINFVFFILILVVQLQVFCVLIRRLLLFLYRFSSLAYSVSGRIPKLSPWLCEKGIKQWDRLRRVHSHSTHEVTRKISHSKQEDLKSGLTFEFCYSCYQNPFHQKQIKSEFSN